MYLMTLAFTAATGSGTSNPLSTWLGLAFDNTWPVLLFAFGFGMLIFVHELGHFMAAKFVGIKVETFALGFGPRLFAFKRGETEYRVSAILFGGYVKMLGQDDLHPEDRVDDERSFCNKSVGQRFFVIASGVVMNVVCALLMFIILFRFTGVDFQRAEVGGVVPDTPADRAGLLPEDAILAVGGNAVRDFGELTTRIALAREGREVLLRISRPGRTEPLELAVLPDYLHPKDKIRAIGVMPPATLVVADPLDYAGAGELEKDDVIIGLNFDGQRHYYQKYYQFAEAIADRRARPTNILATRDGRELPPVMVRPHLEAGSHVMGLCTPVRIGAVDKNSPAQTAGLRPGDVIASFDGHPWPDASAVVRIAQLAGESRRTVPINVLRAGATVHLTISPRKPTRKHTPMGIALESDYQHLYVACDYPELYTDDDRPSPLNLRPQEKIDIPPGASLLTLNGQSLANWSDLIDKLEEQAGKRVELRYLLDGKKQSVRFTVPSAESSVWREHWRFYVNLATKPDLVRVRADSFGGAVYIGLQKTWFWLQNVYVTLTRLAQGSVKSEALAGPLGIAKLGLQIAYIGGPIRFFYFMAIIGVNLAIVNFLPIPVLDGGHGLFLLIEKLKGSPVSVRVQTVASTVSLGAILLLLLLITFQDLLSIFGLN